MYRRLYPEDIELLFGIEIPDYEACRGKGKDGITVKQKDFIHALNLNVTGLKYKAQASVVIDCVLQRRAKGLATIKQLQTIRNLGLKTPKPIPLLTINEASAILQRYL